MQNKSFKILPWIIIIILVFLLIFLKCCCGDNIISGPDKKDIKKKDTNCVKGKVVNSSSKPTEKVNSFPKSKNDLFSVSRFGAGVFLVTGSKGLVVTTPNGGLNWNTRTSGTNNDLYGSAVLNYDTMVAAGQNGKIIISKDKGVTWDSVKSRTNKNIRSVSFPNKYIGYAVGDSGLILKTTNSGFAWDTLKRQSTIGLKSVCFIDSNIGWIAGDKGYIFKTVNGGSNWTNQNSDSSYNINGISFNNFNRGTAVGNSSRILETYNGGNTWIPLANANSTIYNGVHRASNTLAYVVGKGVILRIDKGTIHQIYSNNSEIFNAVDPWPYISGIAVGNGTAIAYVNCVECNCDNNADHELVLTTPNENIEQTWKYSFRLNPNRSFMYLLKIITPGLIIDNTILRGWTQLDGNPSDPKEIVVNSSNSYNSNYFLHNLIDSYGQSDAATLLINGDNYGSIELTLSRNPNNINSNDPGKIEFYFGDLTSPGSTQSQGSGTGNDTTFCHKITYNLGQ